MAMKKRSAAKSKPLKKGKTLEPTKPLVTTGHHIPGGKITTR
jgi:hypothetical protein